MKKENLVNTVRCLKDTLEAFRDSEVEDTRIFPIYAEYLVALKLTQAGFNIQVVNRRSYDILLNGHVQIEVKTGKYEYGCAGASFGKGNQIKDGKFHYCIFVTHDRLRVKEILVFSREELEEVALKPRGSPVVRYPKTNPCILLRYDNPDAYIKSMEGQEKLDIEVELHEHPERFLIRWDKITT